MKDSPTPPPAPPRMKHRLGPVAVDEHLYRRVWAYCTRTGARPSEVIRRALTAWLAEEGRA